MPPNPLAPIERLALLGLTARERDLAADYATFRQTVEARLTLPAGAIGTTHGIDATAWTVVEVAAQMEPSP